MALSPVSPTSTEADTHVRKFTSMENAAITANITAGPQKALSRTHARCRCCPTLKASHTSTAATNTRLRRKLVSRVLGTRWENSA